ncbi:MAG TPA: carbonic anhydrase [Streptosporangiaceae bacterium]|nr:carbonic anhydrase [Streptosporangiaceae bacterium]
MSAADDLIANNQRYARSFRSGASGRPSRGVAVVACMDARMDVYALLGLAPGEAHVIRNAGGEITEDALRSLTISQHELGTTEVLLIHHSACGMQTFSNKEFKAGLQAETGLKPHWASLAFSDVDADVRKSVARVTACPFLRHTDAVRGFVYDVSTGLLREVS